MFVVCPQRVLWTITRHNPPLTVSSDKLSLLLYALLRPYRRASTNLHTGVSLQNGHVESSRDGDNMVGSNFGQHLIRLWILVEGS